MGRGEKGEDGGKNLGPSSIGEGYSRIGGIQLPPPHSHQRFSEDFKLARPKAVSLSLIILPFISPLSLVVKRVIVADL